MIGPIPKLGVDVPKELARPRLPAPPDVVDQLAERLQRDGKFGADMKGLQGLHKGVGSWKQAPPTRSDPRGEGF